MATGRLNVATGSLSRNCILVERSNKLYFLEHISFICVDSKEPVATKVANVVEQRCLRTDEVQFLCFVRPYVTVTTITFCRVTVCDVLKIRFVSETDAKQVGSALFWTLNVDRFYILLNPHFFGFSVC